VNPQLAHAFDLGVWGVAGALVVVIGGLAAAAVIGCAVNDLRWRLMRRRAGALAAGPWEPAAGGVHVLLAGGPARFRAAARRVVVENGGVLLLDAGLSPRAGLSRDVLVTEGATLRISAAEIGEPEDGPGGGEAVWLCVRRSAASRQEPGARSRGSGRQPRP
jgi:hypothetical protein